MIPQNFNNCHSKWGAHPEYTYYTRHYGEIIKVHEDGSCDIKTKPLLSYEEGEIIRNVNLFYVDPWNEDRRDMIIDRLKKNIRVGCWVELMEQRNLFYIYTWEKKYRYGEFKYVFKSGSPHQGPRKRFLIERVWTSEEKMNNGRWNH
ncbi:MAG: hypothetical protein IJH63_00240 [Methanobrevibacter sp.]|nr:hypothetical protein [Methanosphaera sp.]MBR0369132.1 hypothetical protein [Methanobrevibacter sp.]